MKKRTASIILTLIVIVALAFITTEFILPILNDLFDKRTYSQTNCLTEKITADMDMNDIAKLYRDGQATVEVSVSGYYKTAEKYSGTGGSGVCVASKGYETSLENKLVANMGSYVVTNYHVIDICLSDEWSNCSISIIPEDEKEYSCELLWYNKDLDVAILYSDEVNLNYVTMQDRVINCAEKDKLDYEDIFTIGTPKDHDYHNRYTKGNVASNNAMIFYTGEVVYPIVDSKGNITGYTTKSTSSSLYAYEVMSNVYEDAVDINIDMTSGNSGGGLFDENGILVGLTTLGMSVDYTNGVQMNGMVPIYPVIEVLDKLIENNESNGLNTIYTLENLNIVGVDGYEASMVSAMYEANLEYYLEDEVDENDLYFYYLDGKFYDSSYANDFKFYDYGYYVISNSNTALKSISRGSVITGIQISGQSKIEVLDRNDVVYALLQIDNGDSVIFYYQSSLGVNKTITVTF